MLELIVNHFESIKICLKEVIDFKGPYELFTGLLPSINFKLLEFFNKVFIYQPTKSRCVSRLGPSV